METFGFSKRTYLKPGAVPTKFECWENKVHLHKIDKRRKKNTLQQKRDENRILNDSSDKAVEQCISENQPVILSHLIKSECTENQTVSLSNWIKSECESQTHRDSENESKHALQEHIQFLQKNADQAVSENEKLTVEIRHIKVEPETETEYIENL